MTRQEIEDRLEKHKGTECLNLVSELLRIRRHKYRDSLENGASGELCGRSQECRDLLKIFE